MPFLHPGQPLLPGPHISHGSDIAGDCELCVTTSTSTSLCCIFLLQTLLYLFVYRRDDATNAVMTWQATLVTSCDTWHVFIPDISLHHYTRTTARSRATRILCYNSLLLWWWWTVMMAVCDAVMMPGAVKTLRWLAPWWRAWLGARGQRSRCPAWSSLTPSLTCEGHNLSRGIQDTADAMLNVACLLLREACHCVRGPGSRPSNLRLQTWI